MRVAYVTTYDATDIRTWSGLPFHIAQALGQQAIRLVHINPLTERYSPVQRLKGRVYRHLVRKRHLLRLERSILDGYARQVRERLSGLDVDLIFGLGSSTIARVNCGKPLVFYADATFGTLVDTYEEYSNLSRETLRIGHAMEQEALERCDLALFSSEHAATSAIADYGTDPRKVKVVPFGANLESNSSRDDIRAAIEARARDRCRLLFLGVNWRRKGGDIAMAVAEQLNARGLATELTFVGGAPAGGQGLPRFARYAGFIDKGSATDVARLTGLLRESHFLILPSRAESFGIAFCEANSFGVPCLASNVDGIPTVIADGVNGQTFRRNASPGDYCAFVLDLFADYARYQALALSSFDEYRRRLNWSVAGRTISRYLLDLVAGDGRGDPPTPVAHRPAVCGEHPAAL